MHEPAKDLLSPATYYADDFLTHSIDPGFLARVAASFRAAYAPGPDVDAVLTPAVSGIAVGLAFAQALNVRCIVARKQVGVATRGPFLSGTATSYTAGNEVRFLIAQRQLAGVRAVLLADDFLASGSALLAVLSICRASSIRVPAAAVVFAKPAEGGQDRLAELGVPVWAHATLESC